MTIKGTITTLVLGAAIGLAGCATTGTNMSNADVKRVEGEIAFCGDMFNSMINYVESDAHRQKLVKYMHSCVSAIECGEGCPYAGYLRNVESRIE